MKTLNDFKDEVAKENGYKDWKDLMLNNFDIYVDKKADLAAERYAEYVAICFCEYLKDYTREADVIIGNDERTSKELYDIFRKNKQ